MWILRTPRGDWRGLREGRNVSALEPVGTERQERITVTCADTSVIACPPSQARGKRGNGETLRLEEGWRRIGSGSLHYRHQEAECVQTPEEKHVIWTVCLEGSSF